MIEYEAWGRHEYIRTQQNAGRILGPQIHRESELEVNTPLDSVLLNIHNVGHPILAIHHDPYPVTLVNVVEPGMCARPVIVMSPHSHAAERSVLQSLSGVLGSRCHHHKLRHDDHKG